MKPARSHCSVHVVTDEKHRRSVVGDSETTGTLWD